jgi:hypothetical protein
MISKLNFGRNNPKNIDASQRKTIHLVNVNADSSIPLVPKRTMPTSSLLL